MADRGELMLDFWREQGISEILLALVKKYREKYPYTGEPLTNKVKYRYIGCEILEQAITAILAGENILLAGPKATGKNVLAENLAAGFNRPDFNISFHINMDASYLLGTDTFAEGEVRFRPGPVYECATAGGFGVLDEINMARNEALAVLHSLLDYRHILDVPGHGRLKMHAATRFIATMNHGYAGTRELNEALASRFAIIQLPPINESSLENLLAAELPTMTKNARTTFTKLFMDLQDKYNHAEISSHAVDLRGLIDALRLIRLGLNARAALAMGITNKCFEEEERCMVADLIALRIPKNNTDYFID